MIEPEVIVIGAGPAGALSACLLARRGVRVLLTERAAFPRRKLCGGCLAPAGHDLLVAHALDTLGSITGAPRIERIDLRRGPRALPLRVGPYRVVDRARFDADLVGAATGAGAAFMDGISASVSTDGTVRLAPRRGPHPVGSRGTVWSVSPRVIIVADGLKGTALRSRSGFGWRVDPRAPVGMGAMIATLPPECAPDAVTMLLGAPGYAGIAPLGDGRGVIAAAVDPAWVGRSHDAVPLVALLDELGLDLGLDLSSDGAADGPGLSITAGAPGLTRTREAIEGGGGERGGGGIFLVGDAAGYVEPFTGEGMTWALQDAQRVARHAMTALGGSYRAGAWLREHRAINRRRHLLCRVSVGLLRRPRLSGAMIGAGQYQPVLGGVVAAGVRVFQSRLLLRNLPESSVA